VHGVLEEAAAPVVGDEFVDLEELATERFLVLAVAAGLVVEFEAESGGDAFDGFREVEAFAGHDQFEGVAALLGGEAIPEAGLGVDFERGAFLGLERTEAPPIASALLHLGVVPGERDDISPLAELVDGFAGNTGHGCQGVSVKWGGANVNNSQSTIGSSPVVCLGGWRAQGGGPL